MTRLAGILAAIGALFLLPAVALPQYDPSAAPTNESGPPTAQPYGTPPAPPSASPPAAPTQPRAQATLPPGQWVYTQQYGWIWMPYSDRYTYVPADGYGSPYAYVYYPYYGWTWLVAPWIWGYGPWPYFGFIGPVRFAWYGHGWWRYPSRWTYAPARSAIYGNRYSPAFRGGVQYGGMRGAPYRATFGGQPFAPRGAYGGGMGHVRRR